MPARKKTPGDESPENDQSEDITAGAIQQSDGEASPPTTPSDTSSPEDVAPIVGVADALPTPPTEPGTGGERNPAYLRALRAADPDKFAATCTRLRIYGDDIEKALRDPVEE